MIIHEKIVLVYDVEVFPNVFSCTLKNSETGQVLVYELSHRKTDVTKEATAFENGITVYTCKNCGAMKEETPAYQIPLGKSGWVLNSDGSWSYGDAEWNALFGPQAIDGIIPQSLQLLIYLLCYSHRS